MTDNVVCCFSSLALVVVISTRRSGSQAGAKELVGATPQAQHLREPLSAPAAPYALGMPTWPTKPVRDNALMRQESRHLHLMMTHKSSNAFPQGAKPVLVAHNVEQSHVYAAVSPARVSHPDFEAIVDRQQQKQEENKDQRKTWKDQIAPGTPQLKPLYSTEQPDYKHLSLPWCSHMLPPRMPCYGVPICDAGHTASEDGASCVPCAAGSFKEAPGSEQCQKCPARSLSAAGSTEASSCECEPGFTGPAGEECSACSAGTYKDMVGSEACVNLCPANSDSPPGSVAITDCRCNAGFTGAYGEACTACEAGTFKASSGSETCTGCPQNTFSPPASVDDSACTCNKGYTGIDCHACGAGKFKHVTGADECVDCVAGKYSTSVGADTAHTCVACPAHSTTLSAGSTAETSCECKAGFIGPAGGPCVICKSGKYEVGGTCVDCPEGHTSAPGSASSEACLEVCPPGSFGPHGGPCEACEEGKFKATPGADPCVDQCPANTNSASGSDAVTDCVCNAGYTADADGQECTACPAGSFKEEKGATKCDACEAGTYSSATASVSSDACVTCPANSASAAGSAAANDCVCEPGHTGANGGPCEPCPPGTFKEDIGAGECTLCESGTYSKASGAASKDTCTLCSAVSSSKSGAGSTTCECNAGYTGPDLGPCDPCPAGTYKDIAGSGVCVECHDQSSSPAGSTQTSDCACNPGHTITDDDTCEPCPMGTFKDTWGSDACSACRANSVSPAGSAASDECVCDAGYAAAEDGASCVPCAAGSYKEAPGSAPCQSCPDTTHSSAGSTEVTDCVCNKGYEGPGGGPCDPVEPIKCDPGFTGSEDGTCQPCPSGTFKPATGSEACIVCPEHSSSEEGASECFCSPGYWGYPKYTQIEDESEGVHYVGESGIGSPFLSRTMFHQLAEGVEQEEGIHYVGGDDPSRKDKIQICHATGVDSVPYKLITIAHNAVAVFEKNFADIIPAPAEGCPKTLFVDWCKPCRQDVTLKEEPLGHNYCPGGPERFDCDKSSRSGVNDEGVPDSTPCECEFGLRTIDGVTSCNDPESWGSWDPVTKLPRVGCLDTVSAANYARYKNRTLKKEVVAPVNRFWGSTMYRPRGVHGSELSDPGYVDAQEADALCRSASGRLRTNDPLVAGKNEGCPDPCAYTCCNCGQQYTVQVRMCAVCEDDTSSREAMVCANPSLSSSHSCRRHPHLNMLNTHFVHTYTHMSICIYVYRYIIHIYICSARTTASRLRAWFTATLSLAAELGRSRISRPSAEPQL